MTVSQYGPVSRAPGSQGFPLDVLETKTLMWGGSTRIMEAEGTCMISARRFTISCHFRMISEGTSIECATLALRSCGSGAVLSPWILSFMRSSSSLDGEGSITAPAAACDSLFDHLAARATNAAGISRPREFAIEVSRPIRPPLVFRQPSGKKRRSERFRERACAVRDRGRRPQHV